MNYNVVVGSTYWTLTGVNIFCSNLVKGLIDSGVPAHLLLTEQKTRLVTIHDPFMELPSDIPVRYLPVQPKDTWGAHWGALIRYLEELAPCVYIPNSDWRHSCVSSLLSDRVAIVGVVHSDDPMHYDHVQRLGDYWNAIVTVSQKVAEKTAAASPKWKSKIYTIPIGVNVPRKYPPRNHHENGPLRLIYHGLLNQWQKRILDLPPILEELRRRNVPVQLTIAGGGNDELRLRQELRRTGLLNSVDFLGVVPHARMLKILESQDIFILTSEFEGMPNSLLEAMGRGCVPVVTDVESGIPEIVQDGLNGYLVPTGDILGFADRLAAIQQNRELWSRLSQAAYATVREKAYSREAMVESYKNVFDGVMKQIENGKYRRLRGVLTPPPAEVGGLTIFPLERLEKISGVGSFPSILDYEDFEREVAHVKKPKWRRKLSAFRDRVEKHTILRSGTIPKFRVIFSLPRKDFSIIRIFSETMVRELLKRGIDAEILLTEHETDLVKQTGIDLDFAEDVPVGRLAVGQSDGWGAHWGATIRYLESKAPCIYVTNHDWRHSCVVPLLSERIGVVAVAHGNDPANHDHISRLGKYCNAIVTVNAEIEKDMININPVIAGSTVVIPYGVSVATTPPVKDLHEHSALKVIGLFSASADVAPSQELSHVLHAMRKADVPVEFTIIGAGMNVDLLEEQLQPGSQGIQVRILESVHYAEMLKLFDQHDVLLLTDPLSSVSDSVVYAMGRGCIPVLFECHQQWVKNGWNGFVVPRGDFAALVARLADLQRDPDLLQSLALSAYHTFSRDPYRPQDMADDYLDLFRRIFLDTKARVFKRPKGSISPLPEEIAGIGILPTKYSYYAKWIGPFPAKRDYYDFKRQLQLLADRKLPPWLSKAKRKGREVAKRRLYSLRSWKRITLKRSEKKIRLIRKKLKRHLSKMGQK